MQLINVNWANAAVTGVYTTFASLRTLGGKIFVLREINVDVLTPLLAVEYQNLNNNWRVCVNGNPVQGLTELCFNPTVTGKASVTCFVVVPSNSLLEIQKNITVDPTGVPCTSAEWHTQLRGNMLDTQNVTLPWEPCNVE